MPLPEDVPLSGGTEISIGDACKYGIVTVSDRASRGEYVDDGGPSILQFLSEVLKSSWQAEYRCVPDDFQILHQTLIQLIEIENCDVT